MSTHLSGGKVNISLVQDLARTKLLELIEKCSGHKAIIWDDVVAGPIGLVAKVQFLQEREVKKMFHLKPGSLPPMDKSINNIIFITRTIIKHMDIIAENIKKKENEKKSDTRRTDYHLIFVPRKSLLCEQRLQENGVLGNFNMIEEFTCNMFPFENDLVSMEMELAYKEYHLEKDPTCLYEVAQAIVMLQNLYGIIPRISGKGPCVQRVWELVKKISLEPKSPSFKPCNTSQISQLILFDRNVDLLTPLATQLTYEGLIDEIYGIHNTTAQFPSNLFKQNEEESSLDILPDKQIILNSGDELFADLRDKIFTAVGPALGKRAKLISAQFDSQKTQEMTVNEMKTIVKQLPHLMKTKVLLSNHMSIAEAIKNVTDSAEFLDALHAEQEIFLGGDPDRIMPYIEDAIAQKKPLSKVLKLICMQSFTSSGLKQKVVEFYKREIVQVYGLQHLLTLTNLEDVGLLKSSQNTFTRHYQKLRKMMRLTVEDASELSPEDINFVHSMYAPLSVRLIHGLSRVPSLSPELLSLLPGPVIEETQDLPSTHRHSSNENTNVVLVFFIGGCTFAEISALRFLSQQDDNNVEYVVVTTKLINGNSFIKPFIENS